MFIINSRSSPIEFAQIRIKTFAKEYLQGEIVGLLMLVPFLGRTTKTTTMGEKKSWRQKKCTNRSLNCKVRKCGRTQHRTLSMSERASDWSPERAQIAAYRAKSLCWPFSALTFARLGRPWTRTPTRATKHTQMGTCLGGEWWEEPSCARQKC